MAMLETQRLEALYDLQILDAPPQQHLDRICRIAARVFAAPIALFSVVDRERLWFKARHGLDVTSAPREASFCDNATREGRTLVVPDAHRDARFANGILVTGPPHIRFYAGVPVRDPLGNALGTFCIIDPQPRELDDEGVALLEEFAGTMADHMLLLRASRRTGGALQVTSYLRGLLDTDERPTIVTDSEGHIRYHNRAARPYLSVEDPVGKQFDEVRSSALTITTQERFRQGPVEGTIHRAVPPGQMT